MRRRAVLATASAVVAGAALGAPPAGAHPSPSGCFSNSLDLQLTKDRLFIRNGDTTSYTVSVANSAGAPCDLTGVTVTLTLPAADGTPRGQAVTLDSGANYAAGMGTRTFAPIPYVVALNPGVTNAVAEVTAAGVLHDAPEDNRAAITKTVGTTATQPSAVLTATLSPPSGPAPLTVTTNYTLTNTSTTNAPIINPVVRDERCVDIRITGGDGNSNNVLDVGEVWTYVCTQVLTTPGVFPSTVTATGTNLVDNLAVPIAPASTTVTVSKPASGTRTDDDDRPTRAEILRRRLPDVGAPSTRRDAPCIAVPSTLSVRAGELTVVRVTVRRRGRAIGRALVQVTGPGIRRRTITNARGIAIFRVRARRSGQLVIQTDQCSGAERVRVTSARRVVSRRVPRNTG